MRSLNVLHSVCTVTTELSGRLDWYGYVMKELYFPITLSDTTHSCA